MSDALVAQLQRELSMQAAAAGAALAAEQETSGRVQAQLQAELLHSAALREELGRLRAEQYWLRRLGIDLDATMNHRVLRALRRVLVAGRRGA